MSRKLKKPDSQKHRVSQWFPRPRGGNRKIERKKKNLPVVTKTSLEI